MSWLRCLSDLEYLVSKLKHIKISSARSIVIILNLSVFSCLVEILTNTPMESNGVRTCIV